jgi:hypothetical protein
MGYYLPQDDWYSLCNVVIKIGLSTSRFAGGGRMSHRHGPTVQPRAGKRQRPREAAGAGLEAHGGTGTVENPPNGQARKVGPSRALSGLIARVPGRRLYAMNSNTLEQLADPSSAGTYQYLLSQSSRNHADGKVRVRRPCSVLPKAEHARSHRRRVGRESPLIATRRWTDFVPADVYTQHSCTASEPCTGRGKQMTRETLLTMGDADFSRVNLHYLICARDLAREFPERAAVLLGAPDALVQLLAELDPAALVAVTEVRAPLLVLRQEPWWWRRLFTAIHGGRADELQAVIEQVGLMVAKGGTRGSGA